MVAVSLISLIFYMCHAELTKTEGKHVWDSPRCIVEYMELAGLQHKIPQCCRFSKSPSNPIRIVQKSSCIEQS